VKIKTWFSRFLLGFVLVTIGFALGRQTADAPPLQIDEQSSLAAHPADEDSKLVIYSAHMTFRCWECSQIERLAGELLDEEFAAERESGMIEYRSVDYMKDAGFARKYNIASSTLVLVRFEEGKEAGFERLDGVWTKSRSRDDFFAYVREAIQSHLEQLSREAG
jgi:hypothetical protein